MYRQLQFVAKHNPRSNTFWVVAGVVAAFVVLHELMGVFVEKVTCAVRLAQPAEVMLTSQMAVLLLLVVIALIAEKAFWMA